MEIISRKEAIEKGLKRYYTGKPCKHGHVSERLVINHHCCECAKIKRDKYYASRRIEREKTDKIEVAELKKIYPNLISRKEATTANLEYYFTGKPCKHGHFSNRRVKDTGCVECSRVQSKQQRLDAKIVREKLEAEELQNRKDKYPNFISKKDAIQQSLSKYFDAIPCKYGHISEKYISGACIECRKEVIAKRKAKEEATLDKLYPERVSREKALEEGLDRYFTGKPCASGHIEERLVSNKGCIQCSKERYERHRDKDIEALRQKRRDYVAKDKDRWKKYNAEYYQKNKEHYQEYEKEYYKKNREQIYENARKWRKANPEKCAKYSKITRSRDPDRWKRLMEDDHYRIGKICRGRIRAAVKRDGGEKAYKSMELVGCTISELKDHLESTFTEGMSWESFHNSKLEIDHIRPCASFNLTKPEEQLECFNWKNMQFLWAEDNRAKGAIYKGVDYRYVSHEKE